LHFLQSIDNVFFEYAKKLDNDIRTKLFLNCLK